MVLLIVKCRIVVTVRGGHDGILLLQLVWLLMILLMHLHLLLLHLLLLFEHGQLALKFGLVCVIISANALGSRRSSLCLFLSFPQIGFWNPFHAVDFNARSLPARNRPRNANGGGSRK